MTVIILCVYRIFLEPRTHEKAPDRLSARPFVIMVNARLDV